MTRPRPRTRRPERSRAAAVPAAVGTANLGSVPENDEVAAAGAQRRRIADDGDGHHLDDDRGREDGEHRHHPASSSADPSGATASVTIPERRSGETDDSERWELTWPIWHMLPRSERKDIAREHGMKSIGEFEEYMSLRRAMVGTSGGDGIGGGGGGVDEYVTLRPEEPQPEQDSGGKVGLAAAEEDGETDDDEGDDEDDAGDAHFRGTATHARVEPPPHEVSATAEEGDASSSRPAEDVDPNNHVPLGGGGLIATLPEEVQHHILSYLPIERYLTAALVHPSWSTFTRTEHAYKILCRRAYLNQSRRKHLNPSRWNGSYRYMLTNRPRVRTHGGLYVLKYARVKKIQRDMWTEIPVGAVLETVYYRYLYFHECASGGGGEGGNRVTYALTPSPPHEMIPRFYRRRLLSDGGGGENDTGGVGGAGAGGAKDERIVEGRYEVRRDEVKVWAEHSWCHVLMQMRILLQGTEGAWGRFTGLKFERHRTSDTGKFDVEEDGYGNVVGNRNGVVEYEVPDEIFRFVRDDRL